MTGLSGVRHRSLAALAASLCLLSLPGCEGPESGPWLVDMTSEVGLDFAHETGATGEFLLPEIMTAGGALFDFDGDGDLDVYLTNGNFGAVSDPARETPVNRLYRQDEGGGFEDVTQPSGLGDPEYGMGIAVGDIDNDGDPDVYLTNYGPDSLYRNRGDGTFEDVTVAAGIAVGGWSCSATFLDYDRDGYLDLYVTRYVTYDPAKSCIDSAGRPDYCAPQAFPGTPDVLLRNDGDGTFTDVSAQAGILTASSPGLGVVAEDLNDDGWIDLYVANDGAANNLWINERDGTFRDEAFLMGVAYNLEGRPEAGMGVLAADLDGDLDQDLFLTHLAGETNTLYVNRGRAGGFDDATGGSNLATDSLTSTGFGTVAFDIDLDGDLDLAVVNGRVTRGKRRPGVTLPSPWDRFAEPNMLLLNRGDGRFEPAGERAAPFTGPVELSRGLATGDIDSDGDVDLLVANAQAGPRLYRNQAPRRGSWLSVRAIDPRYRRDGIGARVTLVAGGTRLVRAIRRGSSYLSSSQPRAHFGIPEGVSAERIEVRWPDGLSESFPVPGVDREITLERGTGERG